MQKDIRDLVRDAFLQARRRGKPDWREMTIAVLKNRLIQLAGGEFNEQAYGSDSLRALVRKLNDLLRLDTSTYPATVELIDAKSVATIEATPNQAPARDRIRPDLWRAFVDFARRDLKGLIWERNANVFHGHEQLQVAGHLLPAGFQWDVQNQTKGRERLRLSSPLQVWDVRNYVNVFPDGTIRGNRPDARRIR